MAAAEPEDFEKYHEAIYNKFKFSGVSTLTPSEICLTLLSPSWEYFFFKESKLSWLSVVGNYKPTLLEHLKSSSPENLKAKQQEDVLLRQQAGKKFLELLDTVALPHVGSVSDPSLKDDVILDRLKDALSKKNITLINLLLKNDSNHDGLMNKFEFISALESLSFSTQDIVALIRIAGYRTGVDLIPISGFSDFLNKRGDDKKKEEFALFTKLLNSLTAGGRSLDKAFALLDTNKDGVVTVDEFRSELSKLGGGFNFAECKEIFTVIDKDRSGSISLDELKGKLSSLLPASSKKEKEKKAGLLEINVLKGQKFKAGTRTVKVKFGTCEFVSSAHADANPEFKFKNIFEYVEGSAKEIEIETISGKKSEGKAVIQVAEIIKAGAWKKKVDILASNKALVGSLFVKGSLAESASTESTVEKGSLLVTLVRGDALDLKLQTYNRIYSLTQANTAKTITVYGVNKPKDHRFVLATNLDNPEHDLDLCELLSAHSLSPIEFKFGAKKVFIQVVWEDFDEIDESEYKAAAKIQKMWRIYLVIHSARLKSRRILINKKVATYDRRRYLLAVYKTGKDVEVEVHPADSSSVGIDTILSINRFPAQDLGDILSAVTLKSNFKLGALLEKTTLRGNLYIEVVQCINLHESLLVFSLEKFMSVISSKDKNPAEFFNLNFRRIPQDIECKVLSAGNKNLIGESKVFWGHAVNNSGNWTCNTIVYVGSKSSFIFRAKWEELEDISKEEEAAIVIQKNWRAKKEREENKIRMRKSSLVGRRGLFKDGKVYLVSVTEENKSWLVQLHPADNPQVPTFEVIDSCKVEAKENVAELLESLTVEGGKLKL